MEKLNWNFLCDSKKRKTKQYIITSSFVLSNINFMNEHTEILTEMRFRMFRKFQEKIE